MGKRNRERKRIKNECFDLSHFFIKWLSKRLPIYYRDADKFVDLDWHKIEYDGKIYTQRELIQRLQFLLDQNKRDVCFDLTKEYLEIFKIWGVLAPYLWW